jgi:N-formylglutamate amidohydrolase
VVDAMIDLERRSIAQELSPPFTLVVPKRVTSPLIICSPHSGRVYPEALLKATRLDRQALRKSEDCYVDELFEAAPDLGVPLICARFPRAYVDVNREPFELDPELFIERVPAFANSQSVRVVGGLGTIPRIVADGEDIYAGRLPIGVAFLRIERLYQPFHDALATLIEATRNRFGLALLIDCHSMPSASGGPVLSPRPHFVLGDRFGGACDPRLTRFWRHELGQLGYDVQLNRPYAGGFITEHYGRPTLGVHALQIEINRGLYLDEGRLLKTAGFVTLKRALERAVQRLVTQNPVQSQPPLAAE